MSDMKGLIQLVVEVYFMLTNKQIWFLTKYILSNMNEYNNLSNKNVFISVK